MHRLCDRTYLILLTTHCLAEAGGPSAYSSASGAASPSLTSARAVVQRELAAIQRVPLPPGLCIEAIASMSRVESSGEDRGEGGGEGRYKDAERGGCGEPAEETSGQGFDAALCGRLGRLPLSEVRLQLLQELWASLQSHHAHPSPSESGLIGDLVSRLGVGREETAAARHQMAAGSGKSVAAPRTGRAPPEGPGREPDGSHGSSHGGSHGGRHGDVCRAPSFAASSTTTSCFSSPMTVAALHALVVTTTQLCAAVERGRRVVASARGTQQRAVWAWRRDLEALGTAYRAMGACGDRWPLAARRN